MGAMFRIVLLVLMTASALRGQTGPEWTKLGFLIGDWTAVAGEKDSPNGAGEGAFSFAFDINQKVIVRRNNAQYDSGARHDV